MNLNVIDRPNGAAVFEALGIYLDVMRPFIVQNMPVYPGTANVGEQIRGSLPVEMQADFDKRAGEHDGDESLLIDVAHIPHIVKQNWNAGFSNRFGGEWAYVTKMEALAKCRNHVCHPMSTDIADSAARKAFSHIENVSRQIDRPDARDRVTEVRKRLGKGQYATRDVYNAEEVNEVKVEFEAEMQKMMAEIEKLSAELATFRTAAGPPPRMSIASKLGRIVPRVRVNVSIGFGDKPETDPKSAMHRPPEEVIPDLEPSPANANGRLASADQPPNSRGSTSQAVGKHL